mmetsp:Transcript_34362/g.63176  ORF Transcript_34362/g.63176 Transcript_34362/m.63176 type:complete len:286 (-) Transcript_34362:402-1259(-)|eukprot:CAMPEP_0201609500 /NCGR_PEP_ID=MMETSP0492-20130828/13835_1 /ASSEMBLY_ACC=CAM_ASM_000837 /TAXON_ID=420259 /ORGANISM="Thalassiosira gravida, Strain GMp14c1" /LENGTH=285 /DNA_ID=CAMNT_0048074989 /DNA_START=108 /DNA_END=965 /DNA_ORIENTATION=+
MYKSSTSNSHHAKAGNVLNASMLLASLLYVAVAIHFTQPGKSGVLDNGWKEDGFCIHNKEVPYWSSFDMCLYVDVFFSAVLGILYWKWRELPGMKASSDIIPMVIMGTLGHGIAHGVEAVKFRDGRYEEEKALEDVEETPSFFFLVLFWAFFWFPLLKASMHNMNSFKVAMIAVAVNWGPSFAGGLKKELIFPYIQTVINFASHLSQLALSSKEKQQREYMMLPLVSLIPFLVSWNEALFCSSYFKSAGGHVWYDAGIIISYIVFYVDCYRVSSTKLLGTKQKIM